MRSVRAVLALFGVAVLVATTVMSIDRASATPPIVPATFQWGAAAAGQSCTPSYGERESFCTGLLNGPITPILEHGDFGDTHYTARQAYGGFGMFGAACYVTFAPNGNNFHFYAYDNNVYDYFYFNASQHPVDYKVRVYVAPTSRVTVSHDGPGLPGAMTIDAIDSCTYSDSGWWVPTRYLLVNPSAAKAKSSLVCANPSNVYINIWYTCDYWGQYRLPNASTGATTIELPFQSPHPRLTAHFYDRREPPWSAVTADRPTGTTSAEQLWSIRTDPNTGLTRIMTSAITNYCLTLPDNWNDKNPNVLVDRCRAGAASQDWLLVAIPG